MSKFLARKEVGKLVPVDQSGEDAMRKLRFGDILQIEVKKPRNVLHHRKYWALITKVWENQERYETVEQLHNALKIAAGIYEPLTMPNGTVHKIPGTIAFNEMDQIAFGQFYDRVCDLIAEHFLPGVSIPDLKAEIESMIGAA